MKGAPAIFASAVLLLNGCSAVSPMRAPIMEYNCSVSLSNAYGTFHAQPHQLQWYTRFQGDVYVSFTYFVWLEPREGEALRTFGGLGDIWELYVGWYDRRWVHTEGSVGEARIGSSSIRTEFAFQPSGYFARADARQLFANNGDLTLILYDHAGNELQQMEIPRTFLDAVEQHLSQMADEVRSNVIDKENRCRLEEQEEIIVT